MKLGTDFTLVDHNANTITRQRCRAANTVFFGFTRCPEVCPTTLYEMAGWFEALGEQGVILPGVFILGRSERTTPEIMKSYAEALTDRVTGITGDPDEIGKR